MIEIGLEFDREVHHVLNAFLALPDSLRPTHFSADEKIKNRADLFEGNHRFSKFVGKSKSGFFLLGPGCIYSIRIAKGRSIICDCFIDCQPLLAKQFLILLSKADPLFGFACAPEEREKRNRVIVELEQGEVESWVGRSVQKYIPGLYWLTLLSDSLADSHGVPLAPISEVAEECIDLGSGQHLYRFYHQPQDWMKNSTVADLCRTLPGIFDVEQISPRLSTVKNFLELSSILKDWR